MTGFNPEAPVAIPEDKTRPRRLRRVAQAVTAIALTAGISTFGSSPRSAAEGESHVAARTGKETTATNPLASTSSALQSFGLETISQTKTFWEDNENTVHYRLYSLHGKQKKRLGVFFEGVKKAQDEEAARQAAAAEAARQKAMHTPGAVVDGRIVYDAQLWQALHQCEQAETWHAGGHFGNGLVSGGNGLGMSQDAWRMAVEDAAHRGVTLPSTGWNATPDQQMQAAQVFYEDEGWGWACHVGGH